MPRPAGAPSLDVIVNSIAPDSASADFTVTPSGGMFVLGAHAVYFPANSICDPASSTYGPGEWDAPCLPLDRPIDIHAELRRTADGQSWLDFTPSLRFVPSDDPNGAVWVLMKLNSDATPENYRSYGIRWAPVFLDSANQVEESQQDPSLRTYIDVGRDVVFRRIKHFSGYVVGDGLTDAGGEPAPAALDAIIDIVVW
ncbi:MAG TPA: hypothetical protein VHM67_02955 [Gemmatimonadaceae bacterium]|nr:hypothetical protein [Gemmatimonadaceae bacterium]